MNQPDDHAIRIAAGARQADYETFLSRLAAKDRLNVERHVFACESEQSDEHVTVWKRLACSLSLLAPHAVKSAGQRALRYYVSDGKYRLQIFALEDLRNGTIVTYVLNALKEAIGAGVFRGPLDPDGAPHHFEVCDEPRVRVKIEVLTSAGTSSAPEYYKHMLGWNRSALKITLPISAGSAAIRALETLARLAARGVTPADSTPARLCTGL